MDSIKAINTILILIAVTIFSYTGYAIYRDASIERAMEAHERYLLQESDPLTVERVPGESATSVCKDRQYDFRRLVKATKALDIYVQERWHRLDFDERTDGYENEIVLPQPIHYPLDAGFEKAMTFKKTVPDFISKGTWEYRPVATYVVNEKKRITKPLPPQRVLVDCDIKVK